MDNVKLWGLFLAFPMWTVVGEVLYMDNYGHCNIQGYFSIGEETLTLNARGGQPYQTKVCEIRFRAERDEQICVLFDKYDVVDRVNLMIYDNKLSTGTPAYNFGYQSTPAPLCSTSRYLTLKLEKDNYMSTNYQFQLRIMEESQTDGFVNGLDGFVMSLGVIVAIIICVVVLITIIAIVIVCCCCKSGGQHHNHQSAMKMKRHVGGNNSSCSQRPAIEPSAPPLLDVHYNHDGYHSVPIQEGFSGVHEPPPAYSAEPPPYTTTTAS